MATRGGDVSLVCRDPLGVCGSWVSPKLELVPWCGAPCHRFSILSSPFSGCVSMKAAWVRGEWKGVSFAHDFLLASSMVTTPEEVCLTCLIALYGWWVKRVYTVPGLRGWRQQSPDSYPERRHRRLWTPSRAAGGVILDGLADARRLILCVGVDLRASWKL